MIRAAMHVGRLLEVRAVLPIRMDEVPGLLQTMKDLFERAPPLVVSILDARHYGVEPPEAAEHFLKVIKRDNARIERSAFLVAPDQPVLGLQLERMIREAGSSKRRLFRNVADAVAFLDPVLTPEERARLL